MGTSLQSKEEDRGWFRATDHEFHFECVAHEVSVDYLYGHILRHVKNKQGAKGLRMAQL